MNRSRSGGEVQIPTNTPDELGLPIDGWTTDGFAIVWRDGVRCIDTETRITDVLDSFESVPRSAREAKRDRIDDGGVELARQEKKGHGARRTRAVAKLALFGTFMGGMTAVGYYQAPAINKQKDASVTNIVDDYTWGVRNPQKIAAFLGGSNF